MACFITPTIRYFLALVTYHMDRKIFGGSFSGNSKKFLNANSKTRRIHPAMLNCSVHSLNVLKNALGFTKIHFLIHQNYSHKILYYSNDTLSSAYMLCNYRL
jgi:hypothetical protein